TGYDELETATEILVLIDAEHRAVTTARQGEEVLLVAAASPFYAQGGGQVGDRGVVVTDEGRGTVRNTTRHGDFQLHQLRVDEGEIHAGRPARLQVDAPARRATERHHTATHLLHAALKAELGEHVTQAGSVVEPERLRFDFTHGEKLSEAQIRAVEDRVNDVILQARPVIAALRPMAEARAGGFVALFGEKYGNEVRTLAVGDFSKELCGGTHVANSGAIGSFRILSESAI